jgi:hypothetical protein
MARRAHFTIHLKSTSERSVVERREVPCVTPGVVRRVDDVLFI